MQIVLHQVIEMRTFTRIREMLAINSELVRKIESLEKKYDSQFKVVYDAIRQLIVPPETKRNKIRLKSEKEGQELFSEG